VRPRVRWLVSFDVPADTGGVAAKWTVTAPRSLIRRSTNAYCSRPHPAYRQDDLRSVRPEVKPSPLGARLRWRATQIEQRFTGSP
jgi:hypothetical protein